MIEQRAAGYLFPHAVNKNKKLLSFNCNNADFTVKQQIEISS